MKRSVWTAPAVERAAATLLASLPATYRPAVDFQLLTRESGSVRHDLPIWVSTPHVIRWSRHPNPNPNPNPNPDPDPDPDLNPNPDPDPNRNYQGSALPLVEEWRRVILEQPEERWDQVGRLHG